MWSEINGQEVDKRSHADLNETIDQLAKANSVRWYGHVLRKVRKNLIMALDFNVKRTLKRGRPNKTWLIEVV